MTPLPLEITPGDVKARLDNGERVRLIDVREPHEFQQAAIAGGASKSTQRSPGTDLFQR
jgi:rhodanese-related sulfurtransferase